MSALYASRTGLLRGSLVRRILRLVAALVALATTGAACSNGVASCDPPVQEQLDPLSAQHVLPGVEVQYLSNPPTSGPHTPGPLPGPVLDAPIDPTIQVGILEAGAVLVQYRPDEVQGDQLRSLQALAEEFVVVAPNDTLDSPIVATAWRSKLACTGVEADALAAFVTGEIFAPGGH